MSQAGDMGTRSKIEGALEAAGWKLQADKSSKSSGAYGVALRREPEGDNPEPYYVLNVAGQTLGVLRIVPRFTPVAEVEAETPPEVRQRRKPVTVEDAPTFPTAMSPVWDPIPEPKERRSGQRAIFVYETDGYNLRVTDERESQPQPRLITHIHRPAALAAYASGAAVPIGSETTAPLMGSSDPLQTRTFLQRMEDVPMVAERGLWAGERVTLTAMEAALRRGDRRVLAQMAAGSGQTHTLLNLAHRLVQYAGAQRVLLLVDNDPLAYQTAEEFNAMKPAPVQMGTGTPLPEDVFVDAPPLKMQQLNGEPIAEDTRILIASPQRLLSTMRSCEKALSFDETLQAGVTFTFDTNVEEKAFSDHALPISQDIPPEGFDVVLYDNPAAASMRVIRTLLRYFDAPVAAIVSAPGRETLRFFGDPVSIYSHEQAVADGAVLPFDAYAIRQPLDEGDVPQAGPLEISKGPEFLARSERWAELPDFFELDATEWSDAADQAAKFDSVVLETYRDRLTLDMFPTRALVPKTLIVARDEAHADTLTSLVCEVFGRGRHFCKNLAGTVQDEDSGERELGGDAGGKSLYVVDGRYPHLSNFRTAEYPRIGVVAANSFAITTDLRPVEVVLVMAPLRSRSHFEMIKARVTRTMRRPDFLKVTRDGDQVAGKTHGIVVDAIGLLDMPAPSETLPLDRRPTMATGQLLQEVAFANNTPEVLYSLSARLLRLDCMLTPTEREQVSKLAGGATLHTLAGRIVSALEPERQLAHAERGFKNGMKLTEKAIQQAGVALVQQAVGKLFASADLRKLIVKLDRYHNPTRLTPLPEDGAREEDDDNQGFSI